MKNHALFGSIIAMLCLLTLSWPTLADEGDTTNVRLPRFPSISPDGSRIVFAWRGDLWIVPGGGGAARRLTSNSAEDTYSAFSRDGSQIAFVSRRDGYDNIYVMDADGRHVRQVNKFDRPQQLSGFTTDASGKALITFAARIELAEYPSPRCYTVSVDGGEPQRMFDAYGSYPVVSPDGQKVLFNRGDSAWTRRNYRGSEARDVWLFDRKTGTYAQLTKWDGNDGRAQWIDDQSFVYASDRLDNCVNLYRMRLGQTEQQVERLTSYTDLDVDDFDVSADGKRLVFARWDKLYELDLAAPGAPPVPISIVADEDTDDRVQLKSVDRAATDAALSPDARTIAVIAYGQLYVRAAETRSLPRRITSGAARCTSVAWSADGERLFFTSDQSGVEGIYAATVTLTRADVKKQIADLTKAPPPLDEAADEPTTEPATKPADAEKGDNGKDRKEAKSRWADAVSFQIDPVIVGEESNSSPSPSPDNRLLAFRRGMGQLWILDLKERKQRKLVDGWSESLDWRWSPDSRRIAYVTEDYNNNADIWITDADGSSPAVNISRHPDNDTEPRWSADGKILAFISDRVNNEGDVWMVFLDKSLENLNAAELEQYYKDAAAGAKKREIPKKATTKPSTRAATRPQAPAPLDLDDAYLRLKRITTLPGGERELELSPGGDRYIFTAQSGAARATFTVDKDAAEPKRIAAAVNIQQLSFDGEKAVVIESGSREGGRAALMKIPGGELEYYEIADKILIDLSEQSRQKFREASRVLQMAYYDPKLNGLDWPAVTAKYLDLAGAATTPAEWDHVATKFVGELNGSHLGIDTPEPRHDLQQPIGRLGIRRKRVGDAYEVTEVFEQGPAGKGQMRLKVGDRITDVEGRPFGALDTFESMMQGRVGKETLLTVARNIEGTQKELNLLLTPISPDAETALFYNDWRTKTAAKVAEMSGGKIGYIHIRGMDQGSLDVFERDLYAAADGRKGLIIDVRNNGGGWTTDRLLTSIMYPRHAYTRPRGVPDSVTDAYPQDRLFIQRYTLPINMLCNENSFSNAEIISHAFKTLRRGTLVGQQTAGGVISTGGTTLIDGTTVRIPGRGWWLPDGTNMELHGAKPDILVPQTPEAEEKGADEQLKAAVEELMKRVG